MYWGTRSTQRPGSPVDGDEMVARQWSSTDLVGFIAVVVMAAVILPELQISNCSPTSRASSELRKGIESSP